MKETNFSTVVEMLEKSVQAFPRRTALVFGAKTINYTELMDTSSKLAQALWEKGVGELDKVSLWLPNCPEYVYSFFAVTMLRAKVCPINIMFKREEAKFVLEDCEAEIMVTTIDKLDDAMNLLDRVESLKYLIVVSLSKHYENVFDFYTLVDKSIPLRKKAPIRSDDCAEILYTSGTTGKPKGAVLTHKNLAGNIYDCRKALAVTGKDTFICILPLFHSFSSTVCMLLPLSLGGKVVLMRTIKPFKRVIRAILKHRVTVFVAVPPLYNILSEMKMPTTQRLLSYVLNPVRICISGASALPYPVWEKFEAKFKRPLIQGYGLTEASPVVSLNPVKGRKKPESIGLPLPSVQVKVVDDQDRTLDTDEVGELCAKGPNVMRGYLHAEDATRKALKGGWLHTGDLAKIDEDGFIHIMGRSKDMINVRGFNVYPKEIEDLLYKHPHIKEAAAVGVFHKHRGEVPVVFIVSSRDLHVSEVREYLRANLASYKVPLKIIFKEALPKNPTGKVLKTELKKEVENIFK